MMSYSRLDMIKQREKVFDVDNGFQFLMEWVKNISGKGALYIYLPQMSKESALQICRTVKKLSKRRFSLSSLIAYQIDEILKDQELNPNLYSLKKNLKQIEDTPSINRHYTPENKKLKRVKIHLTKTVIYELEFLLANMNEELGKHEYSVEKLLELNLMDLLKEIALGKAENTVQAILNSLGVSKNEVKEYEQEKGEELLA